MARDPELSGRGFRPDREGHVRSILGVEKPWRVDADLSWLVGRTVTALNLYFIKIILVAVRRMD